MPAERTVVKKVKNAVLYSDGTIRIDNVRASYPHVFKPYAKNEGETKKFSIVGLMPKDTHKEAKDLVKSEIDRLLKENKVERIPADKKFQRDGDLAAKEGYDGNYTINASEENAPRARGRDGKPLTREDVIYGGCYVNILIRPWFQDNKYGKRVNAGLVAVQFVRDGEAFGEGRITDEAIDETFERVEEEDGEAEASPGDDDDL